jgi:beta-phosphoglucomutase-like phosphatase (HAD superfamily)
MKKYVFDLDNTLVYTNSLNNESYNYALRLLGKSYLTEIKRITRNVVFQKYNLSIDEKKRLIEYKQNYFLRNINKISINNDLINFLRSLNPNDCVLWTSAEEQRVVAILKWLQIENCFLQVFYSKKIDKLSDIKKICTIFSCKINDLKIFDDEVKLNVKNFN